MYAGVGMKSSRLLHERIRRVSVLIRELGFELHEGETSDDSYTAGFEAPDGFQAGMFIDADSKFLEFAFTFSLPAGMADFLRERIEEIMHTLYEFGCYFTLQVDGEEIAYTVFSKIYFAGLNYFALKETIRDFREAIDASQDLFEIRLASEQEERDGDS